MALRSELPANDDKVNRRLIYGRQKGHKLHKNQARLVRDFLPGLRPDLAAGGPQGWFGRVMDDYALEIGFGGGEHLAARAAAHPQIGHIGCEPFLNGVAKLCLAAEAQNLTNVAIYDDDARDILDALPDDVLGQAYLLYPDPWPKNRHHKRRFINRQNLDALFRVLRPGAGFLVASDIADYLDWTLIQIKAHGGFDWQAGGPADWHRPPDGWPGTRYEAKALAAGRRPGYLTFIRRPVKKPGAL
jgi:tRNA (guanine-N7-)-methyltransferase